MPSVLIVLTAATRWTQADGSQRATGYWAEEFIEPHRAFTAAGLDISLATPGGRVPTVDELSLAPEANNGDADKVADLRAYLESGSVQAFLEAPLRLEDVTPAGFDAVLIPGGHGPMQDLAVNEDLGRLLEATLPDTTKVVAAVCHGQAGLLSAGSTESWLFDGRKLTAFSDEEETMTGLAANAAWLLESRLRSAGADYSKGQPWSPYVVVDGNLVTGQNPASAGPAAEAVLKLLAA
ncbi:type 1 glutamine amidotransferase domain-containing protein [Streptomyces sp. NPDC049040]|uniref:type 1 glutamine amidotransferase domain-containing protein n=1 Tax=Streptomyces sp. NPDC049040 TaxID=3365593 RepID=UPI00371307A7